MQEIRILFDVTCLAETERSDKPSSGIGVVAYNLLYQFLNRPDMSIAFYCARHASHHLSKVKQMMGVEEVECIVHREQAQIAVPANRLISACSGCYQLLRTKLGKRLFSVVATPATSLLYGIKYICNRWSEGVDYRTQSGAIASFDVFFSPMYAPPYSILHEKKVRKAIIIYDFIPLVLDDYKYMTNIWFRDVLRTLPHDVSLFSISQTTVDDYKALFGGKGNRLTAMEVTPISVNADFVPHDDLDEKEKVCEKYGIPRGKRFFFHISTLDNRKNIKRALIAYAAFVSQHQIKDLLFVLGGNAGPKFIEKNAPFFAEHKMDVHNIVATGRIAAEDLPVLYSAAEVLVFVSTYEGFGLPLLEAMKCGCPAVISNIPPLVEIADKGALIVDPFNEQQMVDAFAKLYYDPETRRSLVQAARQRAAAYTWEKTAHLMADSLHRVCSHVF